MKDKGQPTYDAHLACAVCWNTQTIQRRQGKRRERGHEKHLYCPTCKLITRHLEIDEMDLQEAATFAAAVEDRRR